MEPSQKCPTFDVEDLTFAKLSIADIYKRLLPAEAKLRRAELLADLRDAGTDSDGIVGELEAHNEEWRKADVGTYFKLLDDCPEKRLDLVDFLYRKQNGKDAALPESLGSLALLDALNKALEPFGIVYGVTAPAAPAEPPAGSTVITGDLPQDDKSVLPGQSQPVRGYGSEAPVESDPTAPSTAYGK